jgi:sugar O-acyltransferase (sialic acid O-acetyltransferase NeuD family)
MSKTADSDDKVGKDDACPPAPQCPVIHAAARGPSPAFMGSYEWTDRFVAIAMPAFCLEHAPSTARHGWERHMMDIVILGAGGHGRVVLDILLQAKGCKPVGFLDSNKSLHGRRIDGLPVLGDIASLSDLRTRGIQGAIVAIGDNGVRRAMSELVEQSGLELHSAIHPSAQLATNASLGKGVVIAAGALVCAHCQIGDYAILNTGCIVDHESMIGTSVHVCPGVRLAGHVIVESGAFIGIGATVVQNVRIGFEAVIGAGAVVIADVDPMTTVVGVPARAVKDAPNAMEFASLLAPSADDRHPMNVTMPSR